MSDITLIESLNIRDFRTLQTALFMASVNVASTSQINRNHDTYINSPPTALTTTTCHMAGSYDGTTEKYVFISPEDKDEGLSEGKAENDKEISADTRTEILNLNEKMKELAGATLSTLGTFKDSYHDLSEDVHRVHEKQAHLQNDVKELASKIQVDMANADERTNSKIVGLEGFVCDKLLEVETDNKSTEVHVGQLQDHIQKLNNRVDDVEVSQKSSNKIQLDLRKEIEKVSASSCMYS